MNIADLIKKIVADTNQSSIVCTIKSIDLVKNLAYCIPINGDADLFDVRLMADNQKGFLLIPEVNSVVVVSFLNNELPYISMVSKVSEIQLNGTNYDGLVRVIELTEKLNNLENAFNAHLTNYNTHVHAGVTSGIASTSPVVVPDTQILVPTLKNEIENLTVLHGNGN